MALDGSTDLSPEGNTRPASNGARTRVSASKYWCFTSFEMNRHELMEAWAPGSGIQYVMGHEKCPSTGREHIQGFVKFPNKCRPLETYKEYKVSKWLKCVGNEKQNVEYCSKANDFVQQGFDKYFQYWSDERLIEHLKTNLEHFKESPELSRERFLREKVWRLMYINKKLKPIVCQRRLKNWFTYILHNVVNYGDFEWDY